MFADLIRFHQFQLNEGQVELRDHDVAAGQHGFHHLTQASFCIARSGNDQRLVRFAASIASSSIEGMPSSDPRGYARR